MSKLYLLITDSKGKHYRCESVFQASQVARYLARHLVSISSVESNSSVAVDDFTNIITGYFNYIHPINC